MKKPWSKISTKKIYDNPWISVEEDKVINPSGKEGIYGRVHFKNIAIGIIPIDSEGYTYLIGQHRYPLNEYSWEIPMGGGEINIPHLESAKRELLEETGITAKNWELLIKIHTSNSVTDEVGFAFIATDLTFGKARPEETEDLTLKKISLESAIKMTLNNEITDSLSVAALLKLNTRLHEL